MPSTSIYKSVIYPGNHEKLSSPTDTQNFIDNKLVSSKTTKWIDVHDPATNNIITRVPESTKDELEEAVRSAKAAFPGWKRTSIIKRQQIMFKLTHLIREHMDNLATSIVTEQGKTFADAKGDVLRGLQVCETACGITTQLTGEVLEVAKDMETRSYRQPLGITAAICPFNFPAMIPLWSLPLATVTGNCMIVKPSERDPGAAMMIAELCREAGFPPGVVNVVHGSKDTVNFLLDEPEIQAISFVGSNKAGEYIYQRGSANGKRVQANLGAKNHALLSLDANKEHALDSIAGAAFGAAGQRCMALSVLITLGDAKQWVDDLVKKAKNHVAGSGFDSKSDFGPLITPQARDRCEALITSAEKEGAKILLDGRGWKPEGFPDGNWVSETIRDKNKDANYRRSAQQSSQVSRQRWNATAKRSLVPCFCAWKPILSNQESTSLTPTLGVTVRSSLPTTAPRPLCSSRRSTLDKSASTCRFPFLSPCSPSQAIREVWPVLA